jgi:very-short-patch-repair endonuclease
VIAVVEPTAYGTVTELGFAYALKKQISIVSSGDHGDLWFPKECGGNRIFKTVEAALMPLRQYAADQSMIDECESPIEKQLLKALQKKGIRNLIPQVKAGHYRLDLADETIKFAIEVDGHAYHSSKEQIRRDNERQRYLEINGWRMHRFSGSEIFEDAENCARECEMLMNIRRRETQTA